MSDNKTETRPLLRRTGSPRPEAEAAARADRRRLSGAFPPHDDQCRAGREIRRPGSGRRDEDVVTVAGRVYSSRNSGMFMDIHDAGGKIQIFSHKDTTPEEARALLPMIDIGDIIGVTGIVRRTKRGELSINAQADHHADQVAAADAGEVARPFRHRERYRKRHLDIMTNEESKLRFQQRSKIVSGIRRFMENDGFMEVETPMLHSVYGGATAEPFKTHHNTLKLDMYLRIAPELFLKRTLVSGLTDKVFEINRNFRNEGVSTRHNPEFTMMECYWAYADYEDIMDLVERLFSTLAMSIHGTTEFMFGDKEISFKGPFKRVPMPDAVKEATGIDFLAMKTDEEARTAAKAAGFAVEKDWTWGECLAFIFEEKVEGTLIQPSHVTHFPKDISPFAKEVPGEPRLVERFETYCNAWELGNAFSELNDPEEQRKRMVEQLEQAHARGEKEKQLDDEFLDAIDQGMPPAGGSARHRRRSPDHAVLDQRPVDPRHHPLPGPPRQGAD
jgi:lysyl-tRNA synthetase class 2